MVQSKTWSSVGRTSELGRAAMPRNWGGLLSGMVLRTLIGVSLMTMGCARPVPDNVAGLPNMTADTSPRLPNEEPLPGHALVYAEKQGKEANPRTPTLYDLSWNVVWLPGAGGGPARTVYVGGPKMSFSGRLPVHFGFLPSPDGYRVLVWETLYEPEGTWDKPLKTVWTIVELPEGKPHLLHVQRGLVGYLPIWLNEYNLQLGKGNVVAIFDARTGLLSPDLPSESTAAATHDREIDGENKAAVAWRREYLAQRLPGDREVLDEALRTLPIQLALATYLRERGFPYPDTQDDLLLRPMGVVGLWGPWIRYDKRVWPSIAISPDHKLIARAGVIGSGEVLSLRGFGKGGKAERANTFEARVDVYEVSSRRHLWGISVPRPSTTSTDFSVSHGECWFSDLRWSEDRRYLSFTWHQAPYGYDWVSVVDSSTWREVLRVSNASNAFVVPDVEGTGK